MPIDHHHRCLGENVSVCVFVVVVVVDAALKIETCLFCFNISNI